MPFPESGRRSRQRLARRTRYSVPRQIAQRRRIAVIRLLIGSLLLTLAARLAFVQLLDSNKPLQSAGITHLGSIVVPAPRGQILDSSGRVLVGNRNTHVLTIDRSELQQQDDKGVSVLNRLAPVLGVKAADLQKEITPCGASVPAPCWTGEPYQPVPVATDVDAGVVLAVSEHAEQFPGVAIDNQTVLDYPDGTLAAHVLGYTGAVSAADQKANSKLADADSIGRSGLEQSYDAVLRGVDGQQRVQLDARGESVGQAIGIAAQPGDSLVTSIDANVQALAEKSLVDQLQAQHALGKPAPSGAVVVVDPHTGRVIAAASYPTYDPSLFVGGISVANYAKLTAPGANDPLVGRAIAGAYAPGSTFKLITSTSDLMNNEITTDGVYPCPGALNVDGRMKTNFDSESFGGPINLQLALQVSCDTFFYQPAVDEWHADQARVDTGQQPSEQLQKTAAAYGIATAPKVDLPADEQASGSIGSRENRLALWKANKSDYCAAAAKGYPDVANPTDRAYLTQLASENCTDGWRFFAGNNADVAIGQGDTTVSPLQLAMDYSAMVNGGTLYNPTLGWAVVDSSGKVVKTINPKVARKLPVERKYLDFFGDSLHFQDNHAVSGALSFDGSPIKTLIGGKTGTAEVYGKLDTSWLASWGPVQPGASVNTAKYVVIGMIEQAGTGAVAAAPMSREIWEGLLGANGTAPATKGAAPVRTLPKVKPSELVAPVPHASTSASTNASSPPTGSGGSSPSTTPDALPTSSARSSRASTSSKAGTANATSSGSPAG
jgi:penicillin-binding protein 2